MTKRAAIYCRVSTDEQENNTSLEQQEVDCRGYALNNDMCVVEVFADVFTGSLWRERRSLSQLRDMYLRGELDVVLIRTFDRLSREVAHYYVLTEEMKSYGVEVCCVKETYDDSTYGQLLRMITVTLAKAEREKTYERTQTGKKARVTSKGWYLAGNRPPYGYSFSDIRTRATLLINEDEAKVIREIFQLYAFAGLSIRAIARQLNEDQVLNPSGKVGWSDHTISYIIGRGEDLYGGVAYAYRNKNSTVYESGIAKRKAVQRPIEERIPVADGVVPRIVDQETIDIALAKRETNRQDSSRKSKDPEAAILRCGFARCGLCGWTMIAKRISPSKRSPHVRQRYTCASLFHLPRKCEGTSIAVNILDNAVWTYVCGLIKDLRIIEGAVDEVLKAESFVSEEKATLKALEDCKAVIDQYREDLRNPTLKAGSRAVILEDLNIQVELLQSLQNELAIVKQGKVNYIALVEEYKAFIAWCQDFKLVEAEDVDYAMKRRTLRFFGVSVRVFKDMEDRYEIQVAPPALMKALQQTSRESDLG